MIRVLVADDHAVVRAGIVALLEAGDDIQVVGAAADGPTAVRLAAELQPDVVLTDLRMPGFDGDEVTTRILADRPEARVIVLTTYENDDSILRAIGAGARGYLLKAAPESELIAGVRAVAAGEMALAPAIAVSLVRGMAKPAGPELTARELEVLQLVAAGHGNREIAAQLHLGEATVKTHLLHISAKLGVTGRTRAVTRAMELGLLP